MNPMTKAARVVIAAPTRRRARTTPGSRQIGTTPVASPANGLTDELSVGKFARETGQAPISRPTASAGTTTHGATWAAVKTVEGPFRSTRRRRLAQNMPTTGGTVASIDCQVSLANRWCQRRVGHRDDTQIGRFRTVAIVADRSATHPNGRSRVPSRPIGSRLWNHGEPCRPWAMWSNCLQKAMLILPHAPRLSVERWTLPFAADSAIDSGDPGSAADHRKEADGDADGPMGAGADWRGSE